MSELEVLRLLGEALSILTFAGGGIVYLAKQAIRHERAINARLDHLDTCLDEVKREVKNIGPRLDTMNGLSRENRERIAHIEGKMAL